MKPLLSLAMIVKDEAESLAATLASVRGLVDRVVILDTGSTDDTKAVALAGCLDINVPLLFAQGKFIDYSTTRNEAVTYAETQAEFVLMLSGDETVTEAAGLRDWLKARLHEQAAYKVNCRMANLAYPSVRISRSGAGWRYREPTHEVMMGPGGEVATVFAPLRLTHDVSRRTRAKCIPGWQRDVALLTAEVARDPSNTRAWYYLGQSYEMLREWDAALACYRRRAKMDGFTDERFISLLRTARIMETTCMDWALVQQAYLDAYNERPTRAEPLYEIGRHYRQAENFKLGYMFLRAAADIPQPIEELCVDVDVYEDKVWDMLAQTAFYVGEYEVGEKAARRALHGRPLDVRLLQNLKLYTARRIKPPPTPKLVGKDDVLWLLPSRRRPKSLAKVFEAYTATNTTTRGLVIVDQADWRDNEDAYRALKMPNRWDWYLSEGETMGEKVREAWPLYENYAGVGLLGDDNIPRTEGWDMLLADVLTGSNVVSSDDGWRANQDIHQGKMCGGTLWSGDLVRAVGYLFPPRLEHFVDDLWESLGREAACWDVRMDVLVEHRHVFKLGEEHDETTKKAYARAREEHARLDEWSGTEKDVALERIRTLGQKAAVAA